MLQIIRQKSQINVEAFREKNYSAPQD